MLMVCFLCSMMFVGDHLFGKTEKSNEGLEDLRCLRKCLLKIILFKIYHIFFDNINGKFNYLRTLISRI
jgi:hypothetical protein